MNPAHKPQEKDIFQVIKRYAIGTFLLWTVILCISLYFNVHWQKEQVKRMAISEARANFNKDQAYRKWATTHGGVYVPPTTKTPPSPWMAHIPDRDIETKDGKKLTLMNPAYMLREMMDDHSELYGVKGRIVGIVYLRAENKADEWESSVIKRFEKGEKEIMEFADKDGAPHLRLMGPMIMNQGCMKCHGHLNFKPGDVRGAVGVSIPMKPYLELQNQSTMNLAISHGFVYFLGVFGIVSVSNRAKKRLIERIALQKEMEKIATEKTVLHTEMEIAQKIQTCLLPKEPKIDNYDVFAYMKTADEVGGDYYDVINSNNKTYIAIGDVSGHGVTAGLIMMMVQTSLHTIVKSNRDISTKQILIEINRAITDNIINLNENKYMTFTILCMDKNGQIQYSGIHQPLLIYKAKTKEFIKVETNGFWLGIMEDIEELTINEEFALEKDDVMILFTDGITESTKNGEMFGSKGFFSAMEKQLNQPSKAIADQIVSDLDGYDIQDDCTFLIIKKQ